jgi:ABC-type xylose transport system substrate-binding protein
VAGLQNILQGYQSMTVYKPIRGLAKAAAHITDLFLHHKPFKSAVKTNTLGGGKTPTALLGVVTITKANVKRVIADKYASKADVCKNIPAADCAGL